MPCFSPKLAWMHMCPDGKYRLFFKQPAGKSSDELKALGYIPLAIPCRKCLGCRSDYAKQWALRCALEDHESEGDSYFVTLTYSDPNLPLCVSDPVSADDFGQLDSYLPTLQKRDLQLFFKRLRKSGRSFRYFACGEYGSRTSRPHYHCILFDLGLLDLKLYSNKHGFQYYTCDELDNVWKLGNVIVTRYEYGTGAYVAKYVQKQFMCDWSDSDPRQRPFLLMSRNPGIGRSYLDSHPDSVLHDSVTFLNGDSVCYSRPPKYSDYILNNCNRDLALSIKDSRRSGSSDPLQLFTDEGKLRLSQAAESAFRHAVSRKDL